MKDKIILKENGKLKARLESTKYGDELFLTRNGWQWVGQGITPELARLAIEVLSEYLDA